MFNKFYVKTKNIVKENYKNILILAFIFVLFTFPLPYYIETPGGILDVSTRVEIENPNEVKGSFNLAYVTEIKVTLPTLVYSFFKSDWDVLKKEEVLENKTVEQIEYRNHLLLDEANSNATIVGFNKANEYVDVTNRKVYVIHIDKNANTDLQIGDEIIAVNGNKINGKDLLFSIIDSKAEKFDFTVINDGKEYTRYGYKSTIDGKVLIGIVISETKQVDTNLDVKFNFKKSESGPSGGFMMALSIYNYLIEEDITKGLKIVGTGTIDEDGNVGSIGGVKYKLKAAYKEKADIFFVPFDNYDEALKFKNEEDLDINLVSVKTIDDAINYLNDLK